MREFKTGATIYIAGPMRSIKWYNFPAFDAAADRLRRAGYNVLNPADMDREVGFDAMALPEDRDWDTVSACFDFAVCVDRDIAAVKACDAIYMLRGWQNSTGARAEKALAEWLGKEIIQEA